MVIKQYFPHLKTAYFIIYWSVGLSTRAYIFRYMELFDRIDITNEGFVDWDMFVQFMLLEFYEKDEKVKTTQVLSYQIIRL